MQKSLGAGAGNTHFEVFAGVCKKMQINNIKLNLKSFKLSDFFKSRLETKFKMFYKTAIYLVVITV